MRTPNKPLTEIEISLLDNQVLTAYRAHCSKHRSKQWLQSRNLCDKIIAYRETLKPKMLE